MDHICLKVLIRKRCCSCKCLDSDAKENSLIKEKCIKDDSECFDIFPDLYVFYTWSGSWLKQYECLEV